MSYSVERTKKITVTPIKRNGGWLKPGHDGNFMYTGARGSLCTPLKEYGNGVLVDPLEDLTTIEKETLAKELGVEIKSINVNNVVDNIFYSTKVPVSKEVRVLDLSKPWEFLEYRILKANRNIIAPSKKEEYNNPEYRWALVDQSEVLQEQAKTTNSKLEAMLKLADYKGSVDKLTNLLTVLGMIVPKNVSADWLFTEAYKIAESNPSKFLEVSTDKEFDIKLIINKAIDAKVLVKVGKEYGIDGGKTIGTKDEVISYFSSPENTKELAYIKAKI